MMDNCDKRKFPSRKICDLRACGDLRFSHDRKMPSNEYLTWLNEKLASLPHGAKKELAIAMDIDSSKLSKTLNGQRELSARELEKAVAFLHDVPDAFRTLPRMAPIVGYAGAGPDGSVLFATGDGNFGEVLAPEGVSDKAEALEVRGDSMRGLANDGWLIFYDEKELPSRDHMGEPCVCWLEDDRVLVKTPHPGREAGLYNLESVNAPMMWDVPVRYMALITDIKPRRAAQRYLHRNPQTNPQDVSLSGKVTE